MTCSKQAQLNTDSKERLGQNRRHVFNTRVTDQQINNEYFALRKRTIQQHEMKNSKKLKNKKKKEIALHFYSATSVLRTFHVSCQLFQQTRIRKANLSTPPSFCYFQAAFSRSLFWTTPLLISFIFPFISLLLFRFQSKPILQVWYSPLDLHLFIWAPFFFLLFLHSLRKPLLLLRLVFSYSYSCLPNTNAATILSFSPPLHGVTRI